MSREHHWWPVALQDHWSILGKVSWIECSGAVQSKKYARRRIAKKANGHSIFDRENPWHTNFEDAFQKSDDVVHSVVSACRKPFTTSRVLRVFWHAFRNRLRGKRDLAVFRQYVNMPLKLRRDLILLCLSLLIRSPAHRDRCERAGERMGFLPQEDTGKANMLTQVRKMTSAYSNGFKSNFFPIVIHSLRKEFIFGDGMLDALTGNSSMTYSGHALVPLTPHTCIFISCPFSIRSDRNAAYLIAPDWLVDEINEITQIYSKNMLFYASQKPIVTEHFALGQHMQLKYHLTDTIKDLKEMSGEARNRAMISSIPSLW
jgi:hypothetical protein